MKVTPPLIALLIVLAGWGSSALYAESQSAPREESLQSLPGDKTIQFNLVLPPDYKPAKRYPLLISLHGAGGKGADMIPFWKSAAAKFGVILCCPKSVGITWKKYDLPRVPRIVDYLIKTYSIDPNKTLLSGFSDGGAFTYYLGFQRPDLFHFLNPMSGGYSDVFLRQGTPIQPVPMFITHGRKDEVIPVFSSRKAVNSLKRYNFPITYQEEPSAGHSMAAFKDYPEKILQWFLEPAGEKKQ
ncbi:MAG: hypothetical protein ACE15F_20145 [bacterium]